MCLWKKPFGNHILIIFTLKKDFFSHLIKSLTLLGRGGAESARTFFNRPFLHEKRGLEQCSNKYSFWTESNIEDYLPLQN